VSAIDRTVTLRPAKVKHMKESIVKVRQYLLSGVSFAIPFIACGGIMIAAAIALAPLGKGGPDFDGHPVLKLILDIGVASFTLMPVILSAYISNAIAGKPGLVAGAVGGWLATNLGTGHKPFTGETYTISAGFLGALVTGLLAGYVVHWLKQMPLPKFARPIMPILVIPVVSATVVGVLILKVIGIPIADAMEHLNNALASMNKGSAVLFATTLGAMIAFDMGGPINKAAFFFASGLIAQKSGANYAPMGAVAAAICVPPMGLGVATLVRRKLWTEAERESGVAALAMGTFGITEGAIPFAAADPIRIIPCIMLGSAVAAVVAMLGGVGDHAPHGGPIVVFVCDHKGAYLLAIAIGIAVTAAAVTVVKTLTHGSDVDAASGKTT
jgi:PTS system fructose-specific IIC component